MPEGWMLKAHHVTIGMGSEGKKLAGDLLGKTVTLYVVSIGVYETAPKVGLMAAKVICDEVPSVNKVKHVTLCHHETVKPKMSKEIKEYAYDCAIPYADALPAGRLTLTGVVQEVA
jgi:hypothetical protein